MIPGAAAVHASVRLVFRRGRLRGGNRDGMEMAAKKWLAGCLVVILVFVVGLGAAWWFVLRPMWNAGSDLVQGAKDWASTVDLGDDIANTAPYAPPPDGYLTPAQVQSLVQVQEVFVAEMGPDLEKLAQRVRDAQALKNGGEASLQDVATAYSELTDLLKRARKAQANGVNAAGLSRDEYAYIRRQAFAALPLLVEMPDLAGVSALPGMPALPGVDRNDEAAMATARHNAELLRPHLPLFKQGLGGLPIGR